MSDGRWLDIERAASDAIEHFENSIRFFDRGGLSETGLDPYWAGMAFMHAMQAAHTWLEGSLLRLFDLLGEQRPVGEKWHSDLIARACRPNGGHLARPATFLRNCAKR